MKTLLVGIGKNENKYIREWVEHYKNIGFTNIVLFDNNDVEGEVFNDVIGDYIECGLVVLKDYRGRTCCQWSAYQEAYDTYNKEYDWIAIFDCDEFLTLEKDKTIEDYLKRPQFKNAGMIHINWMNYNDSDLLGYDGRPMLERFTVPCDYDYTAAYDFPEDYHVKSIVRGRMKNFVWNCPFNNHTPYSKNTLCVDSVGNKCEANSAFVKYNFSLAYLKHFSTKTITEYCDKMKRGFPDQTWDGSRVQNLVETRFFKTNKVTKEKVEIVKKELGIDVSRLLPDENKDNDVKIFSLCYDNKTFDFLDDRVITPLQVGAANGKDVCQLKDNMGDNISDKNYFYIENTGTYWIWKNVNNCKYKGQMQYRRPLSGISEETNFDEIFSKYDAITCKPFNYPTDGLPTKENNYVMIPSKTVEGGYAFSNCIVDLQIVEHVIKTKFPEFSDDYDKYIKNGEDLYYSNGFILRAKDYDEYCGFLFRVLHGFLSVANIKSESDLWFYVGRNLGAGKYVRYGNNPFMVSPDNIRWNTRIGGFLSERIWTLWVLHKFRKDKIYELPYVKMEEGMYT